MLLPYFQPPTIDSKGIIHASPYILALRDARIATGRDIETGEVKDETKVGNWSGSLAYLILLDHLGNFFSKRSNPTQNPNAFIRAIKDFSNLSDKEAFALYALRCAFAHHYSLINVGKSKFKKLLHHQFFVGRNTDSFISFPLIPWDGVRREETNNLITWISLRRLGDFVESVHKTVVTLATKDEILPLRELISIVWQSL